MYDHEPTVRSRYVGRELLRAAQRVGHNGSNMADLLGWSPSKVSRLLSGKRGASTEDVSAFLALCHVTGQARNELLALNALGYELTWWQGHGTRRPVRFPALADNEATAMRITCFDTTLVPDLLQVPDFTRKVLTARPNIPDSEVEERVDETLRRQKIFDRPFNHPKMQVFLAEYALTRRDTGDVVMSEQAHHFLRLGVRPEITIRLVPENEESIGIRESGSFTLLEFTEYQPAVYLEQATSTAFLEQPETITAYSNIIGELDRIALTQDSSRERIADIAQQRARNAEQTTRPAQASDALAIWATS